MNGLDLHHLNQAQIARIGGDDEDGSYPTRVEKFQIEINLIWKDMG